MPKPATRYMSPVGNCENDKCAMPALVFSARCTVALKMSNDLTLIYVDNALINANNTPNPKSFLMSLKGYFNPSTTQSVMLAIQSP